MKSKKAMKKAIKQALLFALAVIMAAVCLSCGNGNAPGPQPPAQTEVLLKFPHYRTGPSGEGLAFAAQVARFNVKFAGRYRIELEEIPGEQYNDKIKLLYQSGNLPVLFETNNSDPEWTKTLVENNTWADLAPYINADPDFKKVMMQQSIDFNTTGSGQIISLPFAYVKYAYLFYNKEILTNAGITGFPDNWDDFMAVCQIIKNSGVAPISFMTGENAWTTMLMAYAYFASRPEGKAMLEAGEVQHDFTKPVWIDTIAVITQLLRDYGSSSALGAKYPDAANAFLSEHAAIMPQGSWFVPDLSNPDQAEEGFDQKIGVAAFPDNIVLGDALGYGMMINRDASVEEINGLVEFFKFMYTPDEINEWLVAVPGFAPNVAMTAEYTDRLTAPAIELSAVDAAPARRFEVLMSRAVYDLFPRNLPLLMSGDMTPEQMAEQMTSVAENS